MSHIRPRSTLHTYWSGLNPEGYADAPLARREYVRSLVRRAVSPGARIFEPGANVGANLALLRPDYEVDGCDINPQAAGISGVRLGSFESLIDDLGRYDLFLTVAFLMHLPPESNDAIRKIPSHTRYILTIEDEINMNHRVWPRNYEHFFRGAAKQLWFDVPTANLFGHNYVARLLEV